MRYVVYLDHLTGNMFTLTCGEMRSVNAISGGGRRRLVEGGTIHESCQIIDWRWSCSRNGYGKFRREDEERAAAALGFQLRDGVQIQA